MIKQENFAIFAHDRAQYVATPGKTIDIEKLDIEEGKEYVIDNILLIKIGEKVDVGTPIVKDAKIKCTIIGNFRDQKVKTFKYHAKSRTRKTKGHRQPFTRILVNEISNGKDVAEIKAKVEKKKPSKTVKSKKTTETKTPKKNTTKSVTKTTKDKKTTSSPKKVTKKTTKKSTTPNSKSSKKTKSYTQTTKKTTAKKKA